VALSCSYQLDEFIAEQRNLILAGIRADGSPHLTPNGTTGTVSASTYRPHVTG
jgi:hypothetical protein